MSARPSACRVLIRRCPFGGRECGVGALAFGRVGGYGRRWTLAGLADEPKLTRQPVWLPSEPMRMYLVRLCGREQTRSGGRVGQYACDRARVGRRGWGTTELRGCCWQTRRAAQPAPEPNEGAARLLQRVVVSSFSGLIASDFALGAAAVLALAGTAPETVA
jgi:hypothetical protein